MDTSNTPDVRPAPARIGLTALVSDDELAKAFGCTPRALRRRFERLRVPSVRLGANDVRYRIVDIEAALGVSLRGGDL